MPEFTYPASAEFLTHVVDTLYLSNVWVVFLFLFSVFVVSGAITDLTLHPVFADPEAKTRLSLKDNAALEAYQKEAKKRVFRFVAVVNFMSYGILLWCTNLPVPLVSTSPYIQLPATMLMSFLTTLTAIGVSWMISDVILRMRGAIEMRHLNLLYKIFFWCAPYPTVLYFFAEWWIWYASYIFKG